MNYKLYIILFILLYLCYNTLSQEPTNCYSHILNTNTVLTASPSKDLAIALMNNDMRFVAVQEYALMFPGVEEENYYLLHKYGVKIVEGTSDFRKNYEELRNNKVAYLYAEYYNSALLNHFEYKRLENILKNVKGYNNINSTFNINDVKCENVGITNIYTAYITHKNIPHMECIWNNLSTNGLFIYNWNDYLHAYSKIVHIITNCEWALRWCNSDNKRLLYAHINGNSYISKSNKISEIQECWNDLEIPGNPLFNIELYEIFPNFLYNKYMYTLWWSDSNTYYPELVISHFKYDKDNDSDSDSEPYMYEYYDIYDLINSNIFQANPPIYTNENKSDIYVPFSINNRGRTDL